MRMPSGCWLLVILVIASSSARGQVLPPDSAPPETKEPDKPVVFDDRWLSKAALGELERAAAGGEYKALGERITEAILARLACDHLDELDALTDLVYVLRACQVLPKAESFSSGKSFAIWLVEHRDVSRRLLRATDDVKRPEKALERLRELVEADEKAVLGYPELAVAFATSEPLRHYRQQPDPCTMAESFKYYTSARVPFRYELDKMPFELARYLTDTRLNLAERQWAVGKYGKDANPAKCYFDLKYDYDHFKSGEPKKIAKLDYTLANLRQVGGVCIEQAYYAAEVCKALGIPAAVVSGRGGSGIGHAWVACLKIARGGSSAYWDCKTGRYEEHQYFTGELHDPVDGSRMLDAELMLAGAAAQLPLKRREQADTAVMLAKLADKHVDRQGQPDLDVLRGLAGELTRREQAKAEEVQTSWIEAKRKIDPALVEDLLAAACNANLAHKPAWELIVEMRRRDRLPVERLDRFFDVLVTRTAKEYPDYSCELVMKIVPTIPDADKREQVFRKAMGVYGTRPDLAGKIIIALGDDYKKQEKKDKALNAYETAAAKCVDLAEVVLDASGRAEGLYTEAHRRDLAVKMYGTLFAKAHKEKATSAFRSQTSHYQLGKRLAELLRDAGNVEAAERVMKMIE